MAIRPIRIIGDPVLRTVCDPITEITPNVKALVEDLLEGVDMDGRAGLAANQIGVSLRAFSWNIDGEIGYVLNPRIVALSDDEYQDGDEGCLSVPELWYPTERAWYARCEGTDLDGKKVVVEGEEPHGALHPARVRPPGRPHLHRPPRSGDPQEGAARHSQRWLLSIWPRRGVDVPGNGMHSPARSTIL